jgi:hypothetical protein
MQPIAHRPMGWVKKLRALEQTRVVSLGNDLTRRALAQLSTGISLLAIGTLVSCGGGTTGTSSSDSVRFAGYAEGADGLRAANLSMSVVSTATSKTLAESGTNDTGDFSMELPAGVESFVVDVTGVGTTTISRQQRGEGTMTSKLSVASTGALVAEDLFEVQVLTSLLCGSLTLSENTLVVSGGVGEAPCEVRLKVASRALPLTSFRGNVEATCDASRVVVSTANASAQGGMTLDLNAAFSLGCSDIKVAVGSLQAPDLQSIFPVL